MVKDDYPRLTLLAPLAALQAPSFHVKHEGCGLPTAGCGGNAERAKRPLGHAATP